MKKKREIKINVTTVNKPSKEALYEFSTELIRLYNERLENEHLEEKAA